MGKGKKGGGIGCLGWLAIFFVVIGILVMIEDGNSGIVMPNDTLAKDKNGDAVTDSDGDGVAVTAAAPDVVYPSYDTEAAEPPLVYTDNRIPHYDGTDPKWEEKNFDWSCSELGKSYVLTMYIDANMFMHYKSLERYWDHKDYYRYITDENNEAIIRELVKCIRDTVDQVGDNPSKVARALADFAQDSIEYVLDSDSAGMVEYPRYPIETLYLGIGDCEDTTMLMAALLRELGYEVAIIELPSHMAVALRVSDDYSAGSYYQIDGKRYIYIESTGSGWNIGDIPEQYKNTSAKFYFIPAK